MTRQRSTPALSSPLLGLWIAFVAATGGCAQGVVAHEISWAAAIVSLLLLACVIRLTASALGVPAHPLPRLRSMHVIRIPLAAGR